MQFLSQRGEGSADDRTHGALAAVERGGDVGVGQVDMEAQHERRLLPPRQRGQRIEQFVVIAQGTTDDTDWIVQRQDPTQQAQMNEMYMGQSEGLTIPYCLLLSASGEYAPLCPPPDPPASGLGVRADYHETLDLVEIATDVTGVRCDSVDMTIFVDDQLDGRRFAVVSCDDPTTT